MIKWLLDVKVAQETIASVTNFDRSRLEQSPASRAHFSAAFSDPKT